MKEEDAFLRGKRESAQNNRVVNKDGYVPPPITRKKDAATSPEPNLSTPHDASVVPIGKDDDDEEDEGEKSFPIASLPAYIPSPLSPLSESYKQLPPTREFVNKNYQLDFNDEIESMDEDEIPWEISDSEKKLEADFEKSGLPIRNEDIMKSLEYFSGAAEDEDDLPEDMINFIKSMGDLSPDQYDYIKYLPDNDTRWKYLDVLAKSIQSNAGKIQVRKPIK